MDVEKGANWREEKGRTITKLVRRTVDSDVSLIGIHTCINIALSLQQKTYMRLEHTYVPASVQINQNYINRMQNFRRSLGLKSII